jgi:uncharacterized protein involved in oxidation of intracellular sulfur
MNALFIINDPPYGSERVYNALRLAHALAKQDAAHQVTVFLMADAVLAAKAAQKTPDGFYNVERMLKRVLAGKGRVLLCGACMDARGIDQSELMEGAQRSTMDELAAETGAADKVLVFDRAFACGIRSCRASAHERATQPGCSTQPLRRAR